MSHGADTYLLADDPIEINAGRPTLTLSVANTGDRAVQIGSHFHFFEVNRALRFDRAAAFGMRLDIPAGTAVRFEPGDRKEVPLGDARRRAGGLRSQRPHRGSRSTRPTPAKTPSGAPPNAASPSTHCRNVTPANTRSLSLTPATDY